MQAPSTAIGLVLSLALLPPAPAARHPTPDTPRAADLAAKVGSADPSGREEAEGQLEEMGRDALSALRVARAGASGPEASRRLGDLIDLIERRRLLRATAVDLDAKGVPLAEAAADLGRRSGFRIVLDPPGAGGPDPARKVSVATAGPVGFWEAIDRLGASGGARPGPFEGNNAPRDAPGVRLVADPGPAARACYAGPYRVDLVGVERHRQATQAKAGKEPRRADELSVDLRLVAEPGIAVERAGRPRVVEAADDAGADLRPGPAPAPPAGNAPRSWRAEPEWLPYRVPLSPPPRPEGRALRTLRGVLPIVATARTGPLISVPIAGAEGRAYPSGGVTLLVGRVVRGPGGRVVGFSVAVQGEEGRPAPGVAPGPRQLTLGPLRPPFLPDDHVQVLDDRGRPIPVGWGMGPRRGDAIDLNATIRPDATLGPPTTLRYHGVVAEAVEVPFAFRDVPLP